MGTHLGREDHPDIIATIKEGQGAQEEVALCDLVRIKDAHDLIQGYVGSWRVDLAATVVQVARLAIHLTLRPLAARHIHLHVPQIATLIALDRLNQYAELALG